MSCSVRPSPGSSIVSASAMISAGIPSLRAMARAFERPGIPTISLYVGESVLDIEFHTGVLDTGRGICIRLDF